MAKYESFLKGNFDQILNRIHQEIINGSMSASYEDGSDYRADGIRSRCGYMSAIVCWAETGSV